MIKIINFLHKPFPYEESWSAALKLAAWVAVFVAFFLYVFKPFGMHTIRDNYGLICLAFGFITFMVSAIWEWLMVSVLKFKNRNGQFNFARWLVYIMGAILLISLVNFLFVRWWLFDDIQWQLLPSMMRGTFAIGFFPVIILGAAALLRQEYKYQEIAAHVELQQTDLASADQSTQQHIHDIPVPSIRFIEAMQNYVIITYVSAENGLREQTVRTTMKALVETLDGTALRPCHRSYCVNQHQIKAVTGNAQGLLLALNDCEQKIPVSRRFVSDFKTAV